MSHVKIITTSDGSHSLLNETLNETYHSQHGAVQESLHVFIEHGLKFWMDRNSGKKANIFEVGFGTGLNALLSIRTLEDLPGLIHYTSIETFPLDRTLWSALNYTTGEEVQLFEDLHRANWNEDVPITERFVLKKINASLLEMKLSPHAYDIIYFDAFAPNKQPEMWTANILSKIFEAMKSDSVFVTYCAKGQLKRDLRNLGLTVETLPGPPGKKEMVRALKI